MIKMCTDHAITDLCVFFSLTLTKLIIIAFLLIHSYICTYVQLIYVTKFQDALIYSQG